MTTSFRVLSGGRAGARYVPDGDHFVAGRHPEAGLRLDPERNLRVSARHAHFSRHPDGWRVRDLGSRNGTLVNGRRITGDVLLRDGDRVGLGARGPELQVRVETAAGRAPAGPEPGPATLRVRAAVRRERGWTALITLLLVAVIAALAGSLALMEVRARSRAAAQQELEQQIDSLIADSRRTDTVLTGEVSGLNLALQESERRLERLRAELGTAAPARGEDAEALRRELLSASTALRRQQLAASLDFDLIQRRVRGAVAMLWVEYTDGERTAGTAFAVRSDGTLLTNRHLVSGPARDRTPARMAVRFADSDQAFPAHLIAVSREWDLAVVRVDRLVGGVPVVPGLNSRLDTVAPGAPVALIGYPLGGEPERDPTTFVRVARPVISTGLLLRTSSQEVEVQGFGAEGASGSPILDGAGEVVAVLVGGRSDLGVQVLLGVPAAAALELLAGLP